MRFSTWDEVLDPSSEVSGEYVCFAELPQLGTERVLLASEEDWVEGDEWVPSAALAEGMTRCLDDGQIREIVDNVFAQLANPRGSDFRQAVRYYFKNDAFLQFD